MAKNWAYLRVSTTDQSVESQRLGLFEYANSRGFSNLQIEQETASRTKNWRTRKIGKILATAEPGDILLTPEVSRMAGSTLEALEILQEAVKKKVVVHITRQGIVCDGSVSSDIYVYVMGLVSQIERAFLSMRTKEGLEAARAKGVTLGRPAGRQAKVLKLDEQIDTVRGYVALGLSMAKMAALLDTDPKTVKSFIKRREIKAPQIGSAV